MKKVLPILLALLLCLGLTACQQQAAEEEYDMDELRAAAAELEEAVGGDEDEAEASEEPTDEASEEPSAQPTEDAEQAQDADVFGNTDIPDIDAQKIVSLTPAGTEIVAALGGEDRLVGRDDQSNFPESVQDVEVVGDYNGPDVEKVVALEPDVVLAGTSLQQDAIDSLKELDVTVVQVEATAFEDIPYAYELIGGLIGAQEEAQALVDDFNATVEEMQANEATEPAKTVYYAMSYGDAGNWTSGPGSFLYTMIELVGGQPVPDDPSLHAWVEYPVEDLALADPDIILVDSSMGAFGDIADAPGYESLTAVLEGNTQEIDADLFTRPGPRIMEAIQTLYGIVHGDA